MSTDPVITTSAATRMGAGGDPIVVKDPLATPQIHTAHISEMNPVTVYLLAKLRQDVFAVEQQATDPDLDGRDLEPGTRILWAERENANGVLEPVAHIRVLDDGENLRIGRLAVRSDARTGGIGRRIMRAALDLTEQLDSDRIVKIDAQAYLEDWYLSMGYVTTGDHFMEAGIDHVPMEYTHR